MGVMEPIATPDLDAARIRAGELTSRSAPVPAEARRRTFQTVFRRAALEQIHRHGRENTEVEICGVLVGNVYRDASGPWLYVESTIRGDAAEGQATQVTFKAQTWEHVQREMERKHGDRRIVGWYHTHPGFGIFLSGMDLFIQDNFFNLPWQVAFVYDPIGGDEGSFVWRGGKSEREPFLVDEAVTIAESWELAQAGDGGGVAVDDCAMAPPTTFQRLNARLETLELTKTWTVTAIAFVVVFVLAGLLFAILSGAR